MTRAELMSVLLSAALSISVSSKGHCDDRPVVTTPRQTSGDRAVQPDWATTVSITVGTDRGDLVGNDHRVIQSAVDYVARLGGGTVRILEGTYRLRNAVFLQSGVHLIGDGEGTVLIKEPSATTSLSVDSDWYDQEITLADSSQFRVGDGVCLREKEAGTGRETVLKRTLTAQTGNRFRLDKPLRQNLWQMNKATCSTLFPLISGEFVEDIRIADLVLDGNRAQNDELDGNYAGCVFLQDCSRIHLSGVVARNYHGDGISWQICHDVIVENCVSENNTGLGLHPGSGSQRPVIRNNDLRGNDIGIFFCWGVKYGLAEQNRIAGNRVGISIGHRDTDNLVIRNVVSDSRQSGVLFRPERGPSFAGHRNRIESNVFRNNAGDGGAVIEIQGGTEEITIRDNQFIETRDDVRTVAVRAGPDTRQITIEGCRVEGVRLADEPVKSN